MLRFLVYWSNDIHEEDSDVTDGPLGVGLMTVSYRQALTVDFKVLSNGQIFVLLSYYVDKEDSDVTDGPLFVELNCCIGSLQTSLDSSLDGFWCWYWAMLLFLYFGAMTSTRKTLMSRMAPLL